MASILNVAAGTRLDPGFGDIDKPETDTTQKKVVEDKTVQRDTDPPGLERDSESDESVISEPWSDISVASSTTTVDEDASEAIFNRLLLFESLRYLWPQLVSQCITRTKCLRIVERLLRRWSDDLVILAK